MAKKSVDPLKIAAGKTIKKVTVRLHEEERTTAVDIEFTDGTTLGIMATVEMVATTQFYKDSEDEKPIERKLT